MPGKGPPNSSAAASAMQRAVWQSQEQISEALQDLDVGVSVVGPGTEALLFNDAALRLLDLTPDQLRGLSAYDPRWDIVHEDNSRFTPDEHPSTRAIRTRQPVRNIVAGVFRPSQGDRIWLLCSAVPHLAPDGSVTGAVCSFSDITSLRAAGLEFRKNVEGFRLLVECVQDYAIITLGPTGNIQSWNLGAERIKGYRADEIIGKHFSIFYPAEDIESGKPEKGLKVATAEGRFEDLGWRLRKDGSRYWANVIITALRDQAGNLKGFGKVTRDLTERKKAEDEILRSQASLRELSTQLLRTQEEERRRIGRDLHDSIGQNLVMLKLHLDSLESRSELSTAIRQRLAECIRLADETINEVRTTSYALYPPMLEEMGLKSAIPWFLDGFMKRSGIVSSFAIPPDLDRLPSDVELAIFRVLQESLTNVLRHSGSKVASVRLDTEDGMVRLHVADQGRGIPPEVLHAFNHQSPGKLGVGLRGMKERIRQLGGDLDISSTECGTIVRAAVPMESNK